MRSERCPHCHGTGTDGFDDGFDDEPLTCFLCNGSGRVNYCPACGGETYLPSTIPTGGLEDGDL